MPDLPKPDLGPVLRHSSRANATVGDALKGTYVVGAADGFDLGFSAGSVTGHAAGFVEAAAVTAGCSTLIFFLFFWLVFRLGKILK